MKNTIILISLFCFFLLSKKISAQQLKVISVGGTIAHFYEETAGLQMNLVGITGAVEYPVKTISLRAEAVYIVPTEVDAEKLPEIKRVFNLNAYVGKIIGKGTQFQIPVFVGVGKTTSEGDMKLKNSNVGARLGLRYYLTPIIAFFSDASVQYTFAKKFTYVNDSGTKETANLSPIMPQLSIGFVYCYRKR